MECPAPPSHYRCEVALSYSPTIYAARISCSISLFLHLNASGSLPKYFRMWTGWRCGSFLRFLSDPRYPPHRPVKPMTR